MLLLSLLPLVVVVVVDFIVVVVVVALDALVVVVVVIVLDALVVVITPASDCSKNVTLRTTTTYRIGTEHMTKLAKTCLVLTTINTCWEDISRKNPADQ